MKNVTINRNSVLGQLYGFMNETRQKTTICEFVLTCFVNSCKAVFITFALTSLAFFVVDPIISVLLFVILNNPFMPFFSEASTYVGGAFYIIAIFLYVLEMFFKSLKKFFDNKNPKQLYEYNKETNPSIFKLWFKALKEKTCFMVDFK